ncbi:hypothetical protein ABT116_00235 [Streptomyces sp. NPDC002130]|uniref:hypothetical protein n=1 Tax=Streptomyces sp. NPDC002130 TaxID=3155568 RepID=UPI00331A4CAC
MPRRWPSYGSASRSAQGDLGRPRNQQRFLAALARKAAAPSDLRTSKGSAVKWDERRARALFTALREDRSPG